MKLALVSLDKKGGNPPLGLGYLASYLSKYMNFSNTVIIDKEDILKTLKREKPDLIGVSATTKEFGNAMALGNDIKREFDVPLMVGGVHISALPHLLPASYDIGVVGEGEQTLLELMTNFEKTGELKNKAINGLVFRHGNDVVMTEKRKLIENLDTVPFPSRHLFKMKKYYLQPRIMPFASEISIGTHMFTSRGCPYNCVYCSATAFWGRVRYNSPEYVIEELKEVVKNYKIDTMCLFDDLFVADKVRLEKIVTLIEGEGLNEKLKFTSYARANLFDDDVCKLLKRMNVVALAFGLESGSPRILKYLKRNTATVEQNANAIRLCRKYGFFVNGNYMIGNPGETREDLEMTYQFLKQNPIDDFGITKTRAFPGTELWNVAKAGGLIDENKVNWAEFSTRKFDGIILSEHLTDADIEEYRKKIQPEIVKSHKRFKVNPKYLLDPRLLIRAAKRPDELLNYIVGKIKGSGGD
jgi:radical SAM superfamily enzyme YgiQ (UPF0313 family)